MIVNGSRTRKVIPWIVLNWVISSPMKKVDAREVSLTMATNSLQRAGRIFFTAWGRTIWIMV